MSWTQDPTPRSPKTIHSEGYVAETQEFGPIHYVPAQNGMKIDASKLDYVPERVSCITPGNEYVILPLPVAMRRIQLQKKKPCGSRPQVLTPWGLMSVEEYQLQLLRDPSVISMSLQPHPLVPERLVMGKRVVDIEGLLEMNGNILAHKTSVRVVSADRGYPKSAGAGTLRNSWIGRWLNCTRGAQADKQNAAPSEVDQEEDVMVLYPEYRDQA